jgi:hypothetical protein
MQSVAATPEEEEELFRVQKWVEMMADIDTEEVDHLLALRKGGRPTELHS